MNGLENIKAEILADAKAEEEKILAGAEAEAAELLEKARLAAKKEEEQVLLKGRKKADEAYNSIISNAKLESRKRILWAKQEVISACFEAAALQLANKMDEAELKTRIRDRREIISGELAGILFKTQETD